MTCDISSVSPVIPGVHHCNSWDNASKSDNFLSLIFLSCDKKSMISLSFCQNSEIVHFIYCYDLI